MISRLALEQREAHHVDAPADTVGVARMVAMQDNRKRRLENVVISEDYIRYISARYKRTV